MHFHLILILQVLAAQPDMPLLGVVSLHLALLQFLLKVQPDRLDFVDQVLVSELMEVNVGWRQRLVINLCCRTLVAWVNHGPSAGESGSTTSSGH